MVSECLSDHRENSQSRGQGCSSVGKVFAWHAESLGLMPSVTKLICDPNTGKTESGRSEVQSHLWLYGVGEVGSGK